MTQPQRVQLKRAKGWRMPDNTVKVTRPLLFGNPFAHGNSRVAVGMFRVWLTGGMRSCDMLDCRVAMPGNLTGRRREVLRGIGFLYGKNLSCWCRLDQPCHADVLLEVANDPARYRDPGRFQCDEPKSG